MGSMNQSVLKALQTIKKFSLELASQSVSVDELDDGKFEIYVTLPRACYIAGAVGRYLFVYGRAAVIEVEKMCEDQALTPFPFSDVLGEDNIFIQWDSLFPDETEEPDIKQPLFYAIPGPIGGDVSSEWLKGQGVKDELLKAIAIGSDGTIAFKALLEKLLKIAVPFARSEAKLAQHLIFEMLYAERSGRVVMVRTPKRMVSIILRDIKARQRTWYLKVVKAFNIEDEYMQLAIAKVAQQRSSGVKPQILLCTLSIYGKGFKDCELSESIIEGKVQWKEALDQLVELNIISLDKQTKNAKAGVCLWTFQAARSIKLPTPQESTDDKATEDDSPDEAGDLFVDTSVIPDLRPEDVVISIHTLNTMGVPKNMFPLLVGEGKERVSLTIFYSNLYGLIHGLRGTPTLFTEVLFSSVTSELERRQIKPQKLKFVFNIAVFNAIDDFSIEQLRRIGLSNALAEMVFFDGVEVIHKAVVLYRLEDIAQRYPKQSMFHVEAEQFTDAVEKSYVSQTKLG